MEVENGPLDDHEHLYKPVIVHFHDEPAECVYITHLCTAYESCVRYYEYCSNYTQRFRCATFHPLKGTWAFPGPRVPWSDQALDEVVQDSTVVLAHEVHHALGPGTAMSFRDPADHAEVQQANLGVAGDLSRRQIVL